MLRIETRALLYGKHHNVSFRDNLGKSEDTLSLKPEHDPIGLGPFALLRYISVIASAEENDRMQPIYEMFERGEPCMTFGYDMSEWPPGYIPPVLWNHSKPGPVEDPYLRKYWLAAPFVDRVNSVFGFASLEALASWFPYHDQIHWMMENGFGIAEYRGKMIRHGLRQSIMQVNQPYKLLGFRSLSEVVKVKEKDD